MKKTCNECTHEGHKESRGSKVRGYCNNGFYRNYTANMEGCPEWELRHKPKYKLTAKYKNGFSLVDIAIEVSQAQCNEAKIKFFDLTMDVTLPHATKEYDFAFWKESETIQNNIPWLVEKGFIEEKVAILPCKTCGLSTYEIKGISIYNKIGIHIDNYCEAVICLHCGEISANVERWNRRVR